MAEKLEETRLIKYMGKIDIFCSIKISASLQPNRQFLTLDASKSQWDIFRWTNYTGETRSNHYSLLAAGAADRLKSQCRDRSRGFSYKFECVFLVAFKKLPLYISSSASRF